VSKEVKIWYVYLDYTVEYIPRVFYCGKGELVRVNNKTSRNKYWKHIADKYGWRREIIIGTKDEKCALEMEVAKVYEHKTFESDWFEGIGWGANFTRGGEGVSGRICSEEENFRNKVSHTGIKQSAETRLQKSLSSKGRVKSEEERKNISRSKMGEKNPQSLLKNDDIIIIINKYATGNYTQKQLAQEYNISQPVINMILNNKRWVK